MVNPIEDAAFNFHHTARTPIVHPLLKDFSIRKNFDYSFKRINKRVSGVYMACKGK